MIIKTHPLRFASLLVLITVLALVVTRGIVVLSGAAHHFMPHGQCVMWRWDLLGLFIVGNLLIAFAYFAIPMYLGLMLKTDSQYLFDKKIVAGFVVFIFFCGVTHLLKVVTVWFPYYWSTSLMDLATGVVSVAVLTQLRGFVKKLHRIAELQKEYDLLRSQG